MQRENRHRAFLIAAAVAAFASSLTTLAVHLMPSLWTGADTFAEQVALRTNPLYLARLWIVMAHCAFVLVSMAGAAMIVSRAAPVAAVFGAGAFTLFSVLEWLRTALAIFALNRTWRTAYDAAATEEARETVRLWIEQYAGINEALFFLFLTAFTVGLFCYGAALARMTGMHRLAGMVFLVWGVLTLPGVIDTATGTTALAAPLPWVGPIFQPAARVLIGVWLLRAAASREIVAASSDALAA